MVSNNSGSFVISLDYELMWGVRDKRSVSSYGPQILGGKENMYRVLELLEEYDINMTIATVGFLFCENTDAILNNSPQEFPGYKIVQLSPYPDFSDIKGDESSHPHYFGYDLTKALCKHKNIEVASHTYSHFYCLEDGQTLGQFEDDLKSSIIAAKKLGVTLRSIIFPRNQYNDDYLALCRKYGLISYRGNEQGYLYKSRSENNLSLFVRAGRLIDAYINITGHHTYSPKGHSSGMINIPASRFLRSYNHKLAPLEFLKLRRIKTAMTVAAKSGTVFHLWWHPHNLGSDWDKNKKMLISIFAHYKKLNRLYGMKSVTMENLTKKMNI